MLKNFLLKCAFLVVFFLVNLIGTAQNQTTEPGLDYNQAKAVKVILAFVKDAQGIYQKTSSAKMQITECNYEAYAYDKGEEKLYVLGIEGNFEVLLSKEQVRLMKRRKEVPRLNGNALELAIMNKNELLQQNIEQWNMKRLHELEEAEAQRQHFLADSLKAVQDSIERRQLIEKKFKEDMDKKRRYMEEYSWRVMPTCGQTLHCSEDGCEDTSTGSRILLVGLKNDTLFFAQKQKLGLGISYFKIHKAIIPELLKTQEDYRYHWEIYKDSLLNADYSSEKMDALNMVTLDKGRSELRKTAPYGYFEEWGWDDEFSISFNFTYTNVNSKTIKYIDVYWQITNDVGDIRGNGHFKGTGPLEQWSSAKWNWEHSHYYVAGDATHMNITKVILTYMDGKQKTLSKSMLRFEEKEEEVYY